MKIVSYRHRVVACAIHYLGNYLASLMLAFLILAHTTIKAFNDIFIFFKVSATTKRTV